MVQNRFAMAWTYSKDLAVQSNGYVTATMLRKNVFDFNNVTVCIFYYIGRHRIANANVVRTRMHAHAIAFIRL